MLFDLNNIETNPFEGKTFDVCIIGGGVAGITLALYLKKELNILLLEGGDLNYTKESQELYEGEQKGYTSYQLKESGARWLGGSSNLWAGRCHPLISTDFKKRKYIKYSGWPISKDDLDPYIEETKSILDLPKLNKQEFYQNWTDKLEKPDDKYEAIKFFYSNPPTNFRTKYLSRLKTQKNIHCYLNANLTDIQLTDDLSSVKHITISNYKQGVFKASANTIVLAAGGIENARLLLNFNKQCQNGIGNDTDLVGRFFSDHPHSHVGYFIADDQALTAFQSKGKPTYALYAGSVLVPTERYQQVEQLDAFSFHIRPKNTIFTTNESFKHKLKEILCSMEWSKSLTESVSDGKIECEEFDGELIIMEEQEPNPLSKVTLGQKKDRFGLYQAVLDWKFVDNDVVTMKKSTILFAKKFAKAGLGRVKIDEWLLKENAEFDTKHTNGGYHLMCTTRMGSTHKDGVVDSNLKVFGIDNLYITGSSVFTTGGSVNSTFTIVQLTLRLAEHINKSV